MESNKLFKDIKKRYYPELKYSYVKGIYESPVWDPNDLAETFGLTLIGTLFGYIKIRLNKEKLRTAPIEALRGVIAHEYSHIAANTGNEKAADRDVIDRGLGRSLLSLTNFIENRGDVPGGYNSIEIIKLLGQRSSQRDQ